MLPFNVHLKTGGRHTALEQKAEVTKIMQKLTIINSKIKKNQLY